MRHWPFGSLVLARYTYYSPTEPSYRCLCARLAKGTGCPVLAIDYRMAPEHAYPAALVNTALPSRRGMLAHLRPHSWVAAHRAARDRAA